MNNIFSLPSNGVSSDWMWFVLIVLAISIAVGVAVVWLTVFRPKARKRKQKHRKRHSNQHNPTLAEKGGLPPLRSPNQPPPGA